MLNAQQADHIYRVSPAALRHGKNCLVHSIYGFGKIIKSDCRAGDREEFDDGGAKTLIFIPRLWQNGFTAWGTQFGCLQCSCAAGAGTQLKEKSEKRGRPAFRGNCFSL
jgi:hypothetical protein